MLEYVAEKQHTPVSSLLALAVDDFATDHADELPSIIPGLAEALEWVSNADQQQGSRPESTGEGDTMNDPISDPIPAHNTQPRLRAFTITTLNGIARGGFDRCAPVPYLRMSGQWLEQYVFRSGCRVVVTGESRRLVLTLAGRALFPAANDRPGGSDRSAFDAGQETVDFDLHDRAGSDGPADVLHARFRRGCPIDQCP
jgi:hypothetical protein